MRGKKMKQQKKKPKKKWGKLTAGNENIFKYAQINKYKDELLNLKRELKARETEA